MKTEAGLQNNVRAARLSRSMSQQQLADAAGVARQTIGGIETGQYAATTAVALKLARALETTVEDLFWLDTDHERIMAEVRQCPNSVDAGRPARVALGRVRGRWAAHDLSGDTAFRSELIPADGVLVGRGENGWTVELLDSPSAVENTVLIAGCAPVLSLWARSAERWRLGVRVHWVHANSSAAVEMLRIGMVHAAGIHVLGGSGFGNTQLVKSALGEVRAALVNLGVWQEGLVVAPSNPRGIRRVADLANEGVRVVNREAGSGSRMLLEAALADARVGTDAVGGWNEVVNTHESVARAVACGSADAGMSTESMAALFGLDFVPVEEVCYDMAVVEQDLTEPKVREFLSTLGHRWVRSQLRMLGGMDTSRTGDTSVV